MSCPYEPQIDDHVDGTLTVADAAAFEAHLPGCAACAAAVEDFRIIRSTARILERREPPSAAWTRVAAGLEAQSRRQSSAAVFSRDRLWVPLAAAAALLIVLGGASWLVWQRLPQPLTTSALEPTPETGTEPDPELLQSVETQLKLAEEHYSNAIAGLDAIAKAEDSALDPQTADVLQANLSVIDGAIGESRAALLSEPSNALAQDSLFSALQSKVSLLQDTVALINEMRKGNGQEAARIVSGMNP